MRPSRTVEVKLSLVLLVAEHAAAADALEPLALREWLFLKLSRCAKESYAAQRCRLASHRDGGGPLCQTIRRRRAAEVRRQARRRDHLARRPAKPEERRRRRAIYRHEARPAPCGGRMHQQAGLPAICGRRRGASTDAQALVLGRRPHGRLGRRAHLPAQEARAGRGRRHAT